MQKTRKRKRGRPPLPATEGKRSTLAFRVTKKTRQQLDKAAKQSGRSLSQETELRLERSFQDEEARYQTFEDKATYRLMKLLATVKGLVEGQTGKSMNSDKRTFDAVKTAIDSVLSGFTPKPSGDMSAKTGRDARRRIGMIIIEELESRQIGEAAAQALWQHLEEGLSKSETSKRRPKG